MARACLVDGKKDKRGVKTRIARCVGMDAIPPVIDSGRGHRVMSEPSVALVARDGLRRYLRVALDGTWNSSKAALKPQLQRANCGAHSESPSTH